MPILPRSTEFLTGPAGARALGRRIKFALLALAAAAAIYLGLLVLYFSQISWTLLGLFGIGAVLLLCLLILQVGHWFWRGNR